MIKRYRKNLLRHARFMRTLPSERFDLSLLRSYTPCGTVACAIGWTPASLPRLAKWNPFFCKVISTEQDNFRPRRADWSLCGAVGFNILAIGRVLFGLSESEAFKLFFSQGGGYNTAQVSGSRIPKQPSAQTVARELVRVARLRTFGPKKGIRL